MRLLFAHDHRFVRSGSAIYSSQFSYPIICRYLSVFDEVLVVARSCFQEGEARLNVASGPGVSFKFVPSLSSLSGLIFGRARVSSVLMRAVARCDAVIVRLPSEIGLAVAATARAMGVPYGVEVVGCGFDSMKNHGRMLAIAYAPVMAARMKSCVARSHSALYVSSEYLQARYPVAKGVPTFVASNVEIASSLSEPPIRARENRCKSCGRTAIGTIGSMENRHKGIDTGIRAVRRLSELGYDVEYRILGKGRYASELLSLARELGVADRVKFDGFASRHEDVLEWLDGLDVYAQPSRTEGLPRALLEAMSRGLPCVGTKVGAIPEVVRGEFLFRPGDFVGMAEAVRLVIQNESYRASLIEHSIRVASQFSRERLEAVRRRFYISVAGKDVSASGTSVARVR